ADDIAERYQKGQPVLVGTTSVERSEYLSRLLTKRRIPHNVLNAKYHEQEAAIIAEAGRRGAVTVATNMAGRGTDIVLGGNPDFLTDKRLREQGLDPVETPEEYEAAWHELLPKVKAECAREAQEVIEAGGLYVLGTERHESRRIDNQLRGRSGRQGDPGESRFYLSLEDDLMRLFNSGLAERFMNAPGYPDDLPLESKMVSRGIASAQAQVESRNFEIRKNVLKYDDVLSRQRTVVYEVRREVLHGEDLQDKVQGWIGDVIDGIVTDATAAGVPEEWDLAQLWTDLRQIFPVSITEQDVIEEAGGVTRLTREQLVDELASDARLAYQRREEELGSDVMRQLERRVVLSVLDRKWREHLYEMDYLKEGIGLRAMAQRDPLVEYQREGFQLFQAMNEAIKEEAVGFLFNLEVRLPQQDGEQAADGQAEEAPAAEAAPAPAAAQQAAAGKKQVRRAGASAIPATARRP